MPHKDPEAKRIYMREYLRRRREDPEFRHIANVRTVASRQNPDGAKKHREANERWKQAHPEAAKEAQRKADQRPERLEKKRERGDARRTALRESISQTKRLGRFLLYGGCCAYCRTSLVFGKTGTDHVIPLAYGGPHLAANVVPSCRKCNVRKGINRWLPKLPHPKGRLP